MQCENFVGRRATSGEHTWKRRWTDERVRNLRQWKLSS